MFSTDRQLYVGLRNLREYNDLMLNLIKRRQAFLARPLELVIVILDVRY